VNRRRLPVLLALLVAAVGLTGCSAGGEDGSARVWITRDQGATRLDQGTVPAGLTALQGLDRLAKIETSYGGAFVTTINGLSTSRLHQRDWFYFVNGISGRTSSGNVIPVRTRSAPENAVFDVGNLKGYLNKQTSGERLYVVKGTVTNVGKVLSSGIRIEATLLGKDNQVIVKNGTFPGNVIDESLISHMSRVRIEGFLGMRYGEGDVNRDIPTGKTLPFMVVFFDPPEGVESFRVKAIEAEEADRIGSPDGKVPGTGASNQ